jgi:hypothetical protein
MHALRDKVRVAIARSKTERPVSAVVADLNPVLRGWVGYFRNGHSSRKFTAWTATFTSGWQASPAANAA